MKRSEMIEKVAIALRDFECCGNDEDQETLDKLLIAYRDLADIALNAAEDSGMLPPTFVYWNKDKDGKLQCDQFNGDQMNYWENEE